MGLAFVRAAFSPVISQAPDRSDGIYHRDTGALIAQGELGLPTFVGTMQFSTQAMIERSRDLVSVSTPGGGYGDPRRRDPAVVALDFTRGYYTEVQIGERFGPHGPGAGPAVRRSADFSARSQPQVARAGMIVRTPPERPVEPAIARGNGPVIDARMT